VSGTREGAADRGRTSQVAAARRAIVGRDADLRRRSDGREPWGFRARSVSDLLGVHAGQVERALDGEHAHYLVYLPMWDCRRAPYGVAAAPASHALAVTAERLVISRDVHAAGKPPECTTVPFAALLALGWGSSLMAGWLRVMWIEGGQPRSASLLYRASTGQRHVQAVVKAIRSAGPAADLAIGREWGDVWNEAGRQFRAEIEFALAPDERPLVERRLLRRPRRHDPTDAARRPGRCSRSLPIAAC
jgi:hypothetical protein